MGGADATARTRMATVASPASRGWLARLCRTLKLWLAMVAFPVAARLDGLLYRLLAAVYGTRAHRAGQTDAVHFYVRSLGLGI